MLRVILLTNLKTIERIIQRTGDILEQCREDFYKICEDARSEFECTKIELEKVKQDISGIASEADLLYQGYKLSKMNLMRLNQRSVLQDEDYIKKAYDDTHTKQIELFKKREQERQMCLRKKQLESKMENLHITIQRTEELIGNAGMAFKMLCGDQENAGQYFGEMQQIQALGLSVIMGQEEERKRVAREIHDGPAQSLATIVMRSEFCLKIMEKDPCMLKDELNGLMDLVRSSLRDVRKIIFDLRPMSLDDLGLIPALTRYIEQYKEDYGIFIEVSIAGMEYELSSPLVVAIFRVVQEALTNVRKYARASDVVIEMEFLSDQLTITVRDNGVGFDVKGVLAQNNGKSFGIVGMRERIQLLKGKFEIKSEMKKGTEIKFSVPTTGSKGSKDKRGEEVGS